MFERYTERARRVIFVARYESGCYGNPLIEPEHLLLAIFREDKNLGKFIGNMSLDETRKQVEGHTTIRPAKPTSINLPLSDASKRVLAYAAEEAEQLSHENIGTQHLLLGLFREEDCIAAAILRGNGLRLDTLREAIANIDSAPGQDGS